MEERIRVFIVDDHQMVRAGLHRMLDVEEDIEVVGEAASAEEAFLTIEGLKPHIILMDIKMPNVNGLDATHHLMSHGHPGEVIVLSLYEEYLAQAVEAGAAGYLVKDVKREELADAIRRVAKGEFVLGGSLATKPESAELAIRYLREMLKKTRSTPFQVEELGNHPNNHGIKLVDEVEVPRQPGNAPGAARQGRASHPIDAVASAAGTRRAEPVEEVETADLTEAEQQLINVLASHNREGVVTIMLTKIEGSTKSLKIRMSDWRAEQVMQAHNNIVRRRVTVHGGFEVTNVGDGLMLVFISARNAVKCAMDIQRSFAVFNEKQTAPPIYVRIGLHDGEPMKNGGRLFQEHLILASQIAEEAQRGEILVSRSLRERLGGEGHILFDERRDMALSGPSSSSHVYQVVWQQARAEP